MKRPKYTINLQLYNSEWKSVIFSQEKFKYPVNNWKAVLKRQINVDDLSSFYIYSR